MKVIVVLALTAVALAQETYDPKYDEFNVDEVTGNTRLLKSYALCFLSEGKCTSEGSNFKKWIPDALQSDCGKCTIKQKALAAKVMSAFKEKLPDLWERLQKLHDPELKYTAQIEAFIAKYST